MWGTKRIIPNCRALWALVFCAAGPLLGQQDIKVQIHCTVVDDIHGAPIARARLTLSGGKLDQPMTGYTGDQGRCPFPGVAPGQYSMTVEKPGYFPLRTGSYDRGASPALQVAAVGPADVEMGTVTLTAARSISGFVRWQDEEPASPVIVHALRVRGGKAALRMGDAVLAMTNNRGEFRLDQLLPGRYVVYAYLQGLSPGDPRPRVAKPVFYPGSTVPSVADSLNLREVPEISGITIHLHDAAGVAVSGMVEHSAKTPNGTSIHLGLFMPGNPAQPFAGAVAAVGEPFQILDVPPGSYILIAMALQQKLTAFQPIEVQTAPATGVRVTIGESETIPGKAEISTTDKDGAPAMLPAPKVVLSADSEKLQFYGHMERMTNKDGDFHLMGGVAGETYMLTVDAPRGTYVERVIQDSRSLPGGPFPIVAGAGAVSIVLRADGGKVNGAIKREDGQSSPGFVVLAPKNREQQHLFRLAVPGPDGSFSLSDIAPGRYQIFALDRNEEDAYLDNGYLARFEGGATELSVAANSSQSIELKIMSSKVSR